MRDVSRQLHTLRARGSPQCPGPKPKRRRELGSWNDARRAREVYDSRREQLEKLRQEAVAAIDGTDTGPMSYEDTAELANKRAELPPQGVEIDTSVATRTMRGAGKVQRRATFRAPAPQPKVSRSQPPETVTISPRSEQRNQDYARLHQQAELVVSRSHEDGRTQNQSAATEMRSMKSRWRSGC